MASEDDNDESIEAKIARIRRMRGWTASPPAPAAEPARQDDSGTQHGSKAPESAAASEPLWLTFRDRSGSKRRVEITRQHFEIGSGDSAHLRIVDESLSPKHCRISRDEDGFRVRDMRSKQGTFVNDVVVPLSHPLTSGDQLRLGDLVFEVSIAAHEDEDASGSHEPTAFLAAGEDDEATAADEAGAQASAAGQVISAWALSWRDAEGVLLEARLERGMALVLGRSASCDFQIRDKGVSSRHAQLSWPSADASGHEPLVIEDLGSTNGTFVNSHRVERAALGDQDVVNLGRIPLRITAIIEDGDDDADLGDDAGPLDLAAPTFHVVYVDDNDRVTTLILAGPDHPVAHATHVTIGSQGCDLVISARGLAPRHATLSFDAGALHIATSAPYASLSVNGQAETSGVLVHGDVALLAGFRLRVVRVASQAQRPTQGPSVEAAVAEWAHNVSERDADLEIQWFDPARPANAAGPARDVRVEVCMWGDGLVQVDRKAGDATTRTNGNVHACMLDAITAALVRAGFPDTHGVAEPRGRDVPAIHAFRGANRADVMFTRELTQHNGAYAEVRDLFRALAAEVGGS